jgi:hypothetical protein
MNQIYPPTSKHPRLTQLASAHSTLYISPPCIFFFFFFFFFFLQSSQKNK